MQLPKAETVEHESDVYQCTKCGKIFSAPVPNALPNVEFDITTTVFISYLSIAAKMSVYDIKALLHLFGISISKGSITNAMKRLKWYLGPYYGELLGKVRAAPTRYKDETSHRYNGRNFWTWVIATTDWVYYTIETTRGHSTANRLQSSKGVDVCDGYAGYNKLDCKRQRCWAHLLRIARNPKYDFGIDEKFDEYNAFVKKLSLLYHNAKKERKGRGPSKKLYKKYDNKMFWLVYSMPKNGRNFKRLRDYILRFDGEWFTFMKYGDVEPTNNRAERALRPMVIKRRISQQSRGKDSMDSYAMQMSMYMSSKLQNQDYIENLSDVLKSSVSPKP